MSQAAVPNYIGQNFDAAAPGHRFNLYFPVWQQPDWKITQEKGGKSKAIETAKPIPQPVQDLCKALRNRQQQLLAAHLHSFSLPAKSTAPFATGLGNEHPVENGFAFLTPYGLPYLAGSGVKGVLRQAAEEMALFGDEYTDENAPTPTLFPEGEGLTMLDVWWLFGFEGAAGAWWSLNRKEERELSGEQQNSRAEWKVRFDSHLATLKDRPDWPDFIERAYPKSPEKAAFKSDPARFIEALDRRRQDIQLRGALDIWDVFPNPKGGKLVVEIMTPHYSDYYQDKSTPHDAGQPNPIAFLAVPAGSAFDFYVVCQPSRLPESLRETWRDLLRAIFGHAFDWLGFGAKTAVGYGSMTPSSGKPTEEKLSQEGRKGSAGSLPITEQVWENATLRWDAGGGGRVTAIASRKSAMVSGKQAEQFLAGLSSDQHERLKKKKELKTVNAVVEVIGNSVTLKRLA